MINIRLISLLTALLAVGCDAPESAERAPASDPIDRSFLAAFLGGCVADFPDLGRIEAASIAGKWKLIEDPIALRMIAPSNPDARWKAWALKQDGAVYMISAGRGAIEGKNVSFCTVVSMTEAVIGTKRRVVELLKANRITQQQDAGQNYEAYRFERDGKSFLLNLIDGGPMEINGLNATVMTNWKVD